MAHEGMADPDLTPAIVQDADDGRVLMLAWMDDEALRRTRETGEAWFWSRSRAELWHKGETSGNTLAVVELRDDCDGDAILLRVRPAGPVCHTGAESCFAPWLWRRVAERAKERPEGSYVVRLLDEGPAAAARKVGEEGVEAALAGAARATSASSRSSPTSGSTATCCSPRAGSTRARSRPSCPGSTISFGACSPRASHSRSTAAATVRTSSSTCGSGSSTSCRIPKPPPMSIVDGIQSSSVRQREENSASSSTASRWALTSASCEPTWMCRPSTSIPACNAARTASSAASASRPNLEPRWPVRIAS